jgi:hypothetical protein
MDAHVVWASRDHRTSSEATATARLDDRRAIAVLPFLKQRRSSKNISPTAHCGHLIARRRAAYIDRSRLGLQLQGQSVDVKGRRGGCAISSRAACANQAGGSCEPFCNIRADANHITSWPGGMTATDRSLRWDGVSPQSPVLSRNSSNSSASELRSDRSTARMPRLPARYVHHYFQTRRTTRGPDLFPTRAVYRSTISQPRRPCP